MFASSRRPHQAASNTVQSSAGTLMRRLGQDRAGSVGMMFGLMVIPLTAIVGLAIDFGRAYSVHSHTQAALDAAALAAGRVAQLQKSDTVNKAAAAATAYFNQAKPTNVVNSTLQFSPNSLSTGTPVGSPGASAPSESMARARSEGERRSRAIVSNAAANCARPRSPIVTPAACAWPPKRVMMPGACLSIRSSASRR